MSIPTAAALHPSHLKKLRASIFPDNIESSGLSATAPDGAIVLSIPTSNVQLELAFQMEKERGIELRNALERTKRLGDDLSKKVKQARSALETGLPIGQSKVKGAERYRAKAPEKRTRHLPDLWSSPFIKNVNFRVRENPHDYVIISV